MESLEEVKKLISDAKNICVIPSEINEPESLPATLALFYTLKELGKNVNLIIENFPEKLQFLIPPIDFVSEPKNFVISIPRSVADVSQVYYEKNDDNLKIHLTIDKGTIKKDQISFYFSDAKPDVTITLGIKNFRKELETKLDSFGFLLDCPIINIDNNLDNAKFGKINIVEETSISEIVMGLTKSVTGNMANKNAANCLLTGMITYYENFKHPNTKPETLKIAAQLMEQGADYRQITEQLYKTTESQITFLSSIFKNLSRSQSDRGSSTESGQTENGLQVATLESDDFWNFGEAEAAEAIEKIKTIGMQSDLLVLWKTHASDVSIQGFFYSKKTVPLHNISDGQYTAKKGWIFIKTPGGNMLEVKNHAVNRLTVNNSN